MLTILYHIIFYLKSFTENDDAQKEVVFDDEDEIWTELKHQHIYNVAE